MNIVITGTGKGIGYELAILLHKTHKACIHAVSRNNAQLQSFLANCTDEEASRLHLHTFDLNSDATQYNKLIKDITKLSKNIHILINNAGLLIHKPFDAISSEAFDAMISVNLKAPFMMVQHARPFLSKDAHIVNIASMGGVQGSVKFPGLSIYSAAKGGLTVLTECLAEELKSEGISVNALALGAVQTEMLGNAFPGYKAPLSAVEAAEYIADFALNGHKYYNGKILPVSLSTP